MELRAKGGASGGALVDKKTCVSGTAKAMPSSRAGMCEVAVRGRPECNMSAGSQGQRCLT